MFKAVLTSFFISLFVCQPAFSHAIHYEVQLKSELQVNTDDEISGIGMVWRYDPIASADMLKDEPNVKKLEKMIHSNLSRFNFFTKLTSENKTLATAAVQNFKLEEKADSEEPYLQISFTLPLSSPPKLSSVNSIGFIHADPTATAILYYENPKDVMLGYGLTDKCETSVEEKASFNEGEFPQIVNINCKSKA